MDKPLRALIVEDSENDCELLVQELEQGGFDLTHERVQTAEAMKAALGRAHWDVVLSDYSLPTFSGPAALEILQATGSDVPFIIVSGTIGEDTAVTALKAGAHDYLVKGRLARLRPAIERELREAAARRDRIRLEGQLRQAQKMEAIGMLAGGVAHDFNNMLTVILGFSELLIEQIGPDKPIGQDLKEIVAAAHRAAALTRQLLAFSRKQVLVVTPLDLTKVVRDVESMLHRLLGEQITVKTALADDLVPVMADVTQLEQVLMNLSVNARDAMPKGGVLTLATQNITLDEGYAAAHPGAKAGSCAALSVSDTGAGMSPETRDRIFEPFFTTKERGQGTGLGLAAVYGIVKQMNGYIEVHSQPARGTTFTIYLPRTEQAAHAVNAPAIMTSPVGSETILLVEDEDSVRAFAKIALQRFGYQVIEAATAEAALTILDDVDITIHLLLTDIVLTGMDGHELAVRAARRRPHLHVLFMSGYTTRLSTVDGFLGAGIQLLEKPFTAHALLTRTRQLLDHPPLFLSADRATSD